jgi:hypothetical protein
MVAFGRKAVRMGAAPSIYDFQTLKLLSTSSVWASPLEVVRKLLVFTFDPKVILQDNREIDGDEW